ncbi:MAG: hypothetical protein ACXWNH_20325, partial [Vulcanimicrobiaceae bacterium]
MIITGSAVERQDDFTKMYRQEFENTAPGSRLPIGTAGHNDPKPISVSEATIFWSTASELPITPSKRSSSVRRVRMSLKGISSKRPDRKAFAW